MRIILWLMVFGCVAQVQAQSVTSPDYDNDWLQNPVVRHEFSFTRLVYSDAGFSGWPRWQADWPEAETHFLQGLERLTRIDADPEGRLIRLNDPALFDYPWIYAVEVGSLSVTEQEAANLREYLLRGGFLMVDDFHGPWQWQTFEEAMREVFPDRPIVELSDEDEIFHVLYDLDERQQIPGLRALRMGQTWEEGGNIPHWRGILDDAGRVMVAINFNMDMGDAWEHADWPEYPEPYSALAYRFGVNYIVYAMTH
ncbi:MAG: DUF4159 domain-containing protein [Gammaproteobacteria bacterium]|nr:DUF4159 domain-containing protein [Gammaproteobacteria bacterium]